MRRGGQPSEREYIQSEGIAHTNSEFGEAGETRVTNTPRAETAGRGDIMVVKTATNHKVS